MEQDLLPLPHLPPAHQNLGRGQAGHGTKLVKKISYVVKICSKVRYGIKERGPNVVSNLCSKLCSQDM